MESPEGQVLQVTTYEDYKEVEGMFFPHKMTITAGPEVISANVKSILINSGVDDSVFK